MIDFKHICIVIIKIGFILNNSLTNNNLEWTVDPTLFVDLAV